MIIENLENHHLQRIANIYSVEAWERDYLDNTYRWNGFDLISDDYIFQLSYEGTIRVTCTESLTPMLIPYDKEDEMRKVLNEILRT